MLGSYLSGIFTMGLAVAAVLFLRSWRETGDKLFFRFALAFVLMAFERVVLAWFDKMEEPGSLVYLIRLAAFLIILITIYQKRTRKLSPPVSPGPRLVKGEN